MGLRSGKSGGGGLELHRLAQLIAGRRERLRADKSLQRA
jgi:hypothetical protein